MELTVAGWHLSLSRQSLQGAELAARYDRAAPAWERTLAILGYQRAYTSLFQRLQTTGLLKATTKSTVLDYGGGTGAFSRALISSLGVSPRITGVDMSGGVLVGARRSLEATGSSATLLQHEGPLLPYADNSFDLVLSAHALEHHAAPAVATTELMRVLRPGALLTLAVT